MEVSMNKYEIHYIQNSTSSTTHIKATDSQLAYLKFKQLNPKSTVTKLVDCETGKECPLPTKPDNTKEKSLERILGASKSVKSNTALFLFRIL